MKAIYITFGHSHQHQLAGKVLDKDSVAVLPCESEAEGRSLALKHFGTKWAFAYFDEDWIASELEYYPRGYAVISQEELEMEAAK